MILAENVYLRLKRARNHISHSKCLTSVRWNKTGTDVLVEPGSRWVIQTLRDMTVRAILGWRESLENGMAFGERLRGKQRLLDRWFGVEQATLFLSSSHTCPRLRLGKGNKRGWARWLRVIWRQYYPPPLECWFELPNQGHCGWHH